jgi:hypothetical protein
MSLYQPRALGWKWSEALERLPDCASRLAKGELLASGRFGTPNAELRSIPPSLWQLNLLTNLNEGDFVIVRGERIFDLRIFPVMRAPDGAEYLNGLTLAEAFRRYVLADCEVSTLSSRLLQIDRERFSAVFGEGRYPGYSMDFHWPLDATGKDIAFSFNRRSSVMVMQDGPLLKPSELEVTVSSVLADRIRDMVDRLAGGDIIAVGAFVTTGIEQTIACGQWKRAGLSIEVRNSDLASWRTTVPSRAGPVFACYCPKGRFLALRTPPPAESRLQE